MKVINLNSWGLPVPFSKHPGKRLKKIISFIKKENPDIICLQEIWLLDNISVLRKNLKDYYVSTSKKGTIKNVSGLVTLTKLKPLSNKFKKFKNGILRIDEKLAVKGILITKIKTKYGEISILNTHLYARVKDEDWPLLEKQLKQLKKTILKIDNLILAGDLNIKRKEFLSWNNEFLNCDIPKGTTLDKNNPYRKYFHVIPFIPNGEILSYTGTKFSKLKHKVKSRIITNIFLSDQQPVITEISLKQS